MLHCVWVRLSTTQVRCRRGAETGVVQAAWCRGGGSGAAGARPGTRSPTCVFSPGVRGSGSEGPSPSSCNPPDTLQTFLL